MGSNSKKQAVQTSLQVAKQSLSSQFDRFAVNIYSTLVIVRSFKFSVDDVPSSMNAG